MSASGDLREAAARLFAAMRRLDGAGVDVIAALPVPEAGLGLAINDRLCRASIFKKNLLLRVRGMYINSIRGTPAAVGQRQLFLYSFPD
ncbi:MAG: hypothetical protein LBB74_02340 [Chitinispirillales bacterium]|nr:hypothetical protein [Chitinispirillales bacterium]